MWGSERTACHEDNNSIGPLCHHDVLRQPLQPQQPDPFQPSTTPYAAWTFSLVTHMILTRFTVANSVRANCGCSYMCSAWC